MFPVTNKGYALRSDVEVLFVVLGFPQLVYNAPISRM